MKKTIKKVVKETAGQMLPDFTLKTLISASIKRYLYN